MSDLAKRLEDRARSFEADGLGSRVEIALLREAAQEIKFLRERVQHALSTGAGGSLPGMIARRYRR